MPIKSQIKKKTKLASHDDDDMVNRILILHKYVIFSGFQNRI